MEEQVLFGEYDNDGNLVHDADTCILTGIAIEAGDPTFKVGNLFYRVSLSALAQHTDTVRAELVNLMTPKETKKPVKAKSE